LDLKSLQKETKTGEPSPRRDKKFTGGKGDQGGRKKVVTILFKNRQFHGERKRWWGPFDGHRGRAG